MAGYGYGISVSGSRTPVVASSGGVPFSPTDLSGLSLWLKADVGVSKFSFNYISEIVISGTSNANVNGTYTATSVPSYDFDNGVPDNYSFSGPSNGFGMNWGDGGLALAKHFGNGDAIFSSSDGQTWTITSEVLTQVVISGFDGDYEGANDIYNYNTDYETFVNGDETYAIYDNGNITNLATDEILATNTNANYSGNWTLVNGTGDPETTSVTIIPNGSISGITTTSTANTENVTAWADQSGNGNNATAIDAPTLTTVSGKTFVDFAGGYFAGNELITSPYATIMCVARFSSTRDIEAMFQQFSGYDNLLFYRGFDLDSGFRIYNGENASSSSLTNNNQTYLFGVTVNNDTGTLYLNSAVDGNDYCGEQTPAGNYYLGRWVGDERTTTELQMAEIVVYNRVLTNTERQQVEAYLNAKYAIY